MPQTPPPLYTLVSDPDAPLSGALLDTWRAAGGTVVPVPLGELPPPDARLLYDVEAGALTVTGDAAGPVLQFLKDLPADRWGEPGAPSRRVLSAPADLPGVTSLLVREIAADCQFGEDEFPFVRGVLSLVRAYLYRALNQK